MKSLKTLEFEGQEIRDEGLGMLSGLTNLKNLYFTGGPPYSATTPAGLEKLKKAIPKLIIN